MNQRSRTNNVILNIVGGIGGQLFTTLLAFVCRTVFIKQLGVTYLGVSGLFSNILQMLSLSELGISSAIIFGLYKPIAQNDERKIAQYMNFYKKAYFVIAVIVLAVGLALLPFLEFFIEEKPDIPEDLRIIYMLILSNTVVSYLLCYKGSLLIADQKNYIAVIIKNVFAVIQNGLQIALLVISNNFILYLVVQIVTTLATNIVIHLYVNRHYLFLKRYSGIKLDPDAKHCLFKNVKGMMFHKIGGFVLNGTDNLIIAKFINIITVGLYSNYLMIVNIVKTYVQHITDSLTASVGNLIAKESREKTYEVFKSTFFIYNWIYTFCLVSFWCIFQTFISFWIGQDYVIDKVTLFIVLINFYIYGVQACIDTFTNASGLFYETRLKPVFECLINIACSILLAHFIGLPGVFLGTTISYLCTFWVGPLTVFKKQFKINSIMYFSRFALYVAIAIGMSLGLGFLFDIILPNVDILSLILRIILCALLPNLIIIIIFFKTSEFNYTKKIVLNILKKIKYKFRLKKFPIK